MVPFLHEVAATIIGDFGSWILSLIWILVLKMSSRVAPRIRYQFTVNNYTPEHEKFLKEYAASECKYLLYGREIAPSTGTPHLQGFVVLKTKKRMTAMVNAGFPGHLIETDEKVAPVIKYCKKDGDWVEYGDPPVLQGRRSDLEEFKDAVKAGMSWNDLLENHSNVMRSGRGFASEYFSLFSPNPIPQVKFEDREWHKLVYDAIDNPCDRYVHFFVDKSGGCGKTTLVRQLLATRNDVQVFRPEKEANVALSLDPSKKVFIFEHVIHNIPFAKEIIQSILLITTGL